MDLELSSTKRIESITELICEDFHHTGYHTQESAENLKDRLTKELISIDGVDDLYCYQIYIIGLKKLNSLDIIDLEFIDNFISNEVG